MENLMHFGVQGMRWGYRKKYESKPIDTHRIIVKKGETVAHITEGGNFKLKQGRLYIYFDKDDQNNYRGNFPMLRLVDVHEVVMEAKVDLITPTKKRRVDAFLKTVEAQPTKEMIQEMGRNKVQVSLFLSIIRLFNKDLKASPYGTKSYEKFLADKNARQYEKLLASGRNKDIERAYQDFNSFLVLSDSNRQKYFDMLEKDGFNAILDDHDINVYGSRRPVIVFDAQKSLNIKAIKKLTDEEMDKAFDASLSREHDVYTLVKKDKEAGWSAI